MSDTDFASHCVNVARVFWGDPNPHLSTKTMVRWGSQGSKKIDVERGTWFDHENQVGGGVIDLVMLEKGCSKGEAIRWLETEEFIEKREQHRQERHEAPPEREEPEPPATTPDELVQVKGYNYTSPDGELLYQVVRYQWRLPNGTWKLSKTGAIDKTFRQRRKGPGGEVIWNLEGIGHTIYRHQQIELAIEAGKPIYLPEGEKDADSLVAWGLEASTNSGGAKNWADKLAAYFKGADVIIPVDNDETGRAAGEAKAKSLKGIAARIRILDLAKFWPEIKPKQDITDWIEAGHSQDELSAIIGQLRDWSPAAPPSTFGALRMGDIANHKVVYDWLVKGLIERGGVFIVAGEKQAGKSFFVIDLGMKIARGIDYADRKVKQGLVIHMACEDGKGVQMRAEGYRRDKDIPQDQDIPFVVMDRSFSLMDDEIVEKFIAECMAWQAFYGMKLEMIIIDTFSMATEGLDEIQSGEVGKVLGRVNRISRETQSAVCLVHHLNAEGRRVRGHSSLTANVSQVIEIRQMTKFQSNRNAPVEVIKDSHGRIVRQALLEKNKNGQNLIKWRFTLRKIDLGLDDDGYEISTCVLESPSSDVPESQEKASRLPADQKLVLDALRTSIEQTGIAMPPGVIVGPQIRMAVTEANFVTAVRRVWAFKTPEAEVEARVKELSEALRRIVTALLNAGYLGRDNDKKILWHMGKDDRRKPDGTKAPPPELREDVGAPF